MLLSYEDLPSTSSHKSSLFPGLLKPIEQLLANPENNNLEEGEINPESNNLEEGEMPVSPVYSNEYWEPDLEIDLGSPVEHVEVEPDFIQLDEIGSSGSNSQTLPVFGRPLPDRPESVLTFSDLRQSPSPVREGCSSAPSPFQL